jgi:hypothetical protein
LLRIFRTFDSPRLTSSDVTKPVRQDRKIFL